MKNEMDSLIHCFSSYFKMNDGVLESMIVKHHAQGASQVPASESFVVKARVGVCRSSLPITTAIFLCPFQGLSWPFKKWLGNHWLPVSKRLNIRKFFSYHETELHTVNFTSYINNISTPFSPSWQVTIISYLSYCKSFLVDVPASTWLPLE